MVRLTRREMAALLTALPALAQSVPAPLGPPPHMAPATVEAAASSVRETSGKLRAIIVPMNVEPAFTFKA